MMLGQDESYKYPGTVHTYHDRQISRPASIRNVFENKLQIAQGESTPMNGLLIKHECLKPMLFMMY